MGKETKKAEQPAAKTATETPVVENIRESLDSASLGRKELADQALAKIKKDHDERTQNEMAKRFQKAQYKVESGLLKLRRERDIEKITKTELAQTDRLARLLMGFTVTEEVIKNAAKLEDIFDGREKINEKDKTVTVKLTDGEKTFKVGEEVPPVIDYVDYDDLYRKIPEAVRKAMSEVEKVHDTYLKKLDAKYDQYWDRSWYY